VAEELSRARSITCSPTSPECLDQCRRHTLDARTLIEGARRTTCTRSSSSWIPTRFPSSSCNCLIVCTPVSNYAVSPLPDSPLPGYGFIVFSIVLLVFYGRDAIHRYYCREIDMASCYARWSREWTAICSCFQLVFDLERAAYSLFSCLLSFVNKSLLSNVDCYKTEIDREFGICLCSRHGAESGVQFVLL
jgi:hypothetical protein